MVPARPEDSAEDRKIGSAEEKIVPLAASELHAFRASALEKQKVVLDTSLFVNPDVRLSFGDSPTEALETFLFLAAQIHILEFYMPPSIFEELLHFVDKDKISGDLLVVLHQKPPKKYELKCPAILLYELIEDMRERVNKGLRIAESAARGVEKKGVDGTIQEMRKKYREALREGIIDSKEDVDLLLLAFELEALLITADQGLIKWAEKFGVQWLFPEKFKDYLLGALKRTRLLSGIEFNKEL